MKINILSSGRFHVLDLAIELEKLGHEVRFYSYVPNKRSLQFGLSKKASKSIFFIMLPFLAICKIFPKILFFDNLKISVQDFFTSQLMNNCDILISMSGLFIKSLEKAKSKGAIIIVERGSKHIFEQRAILENVPSLRNKKPVPDSHVRREVKSYELADFISVASSHVKDSFINNGFKAEKIFVNPYGVDLQLFEFVNEPKKYDAIFVGNWSFQKGCDLLQQACNELDISLLHVGAEGDIKIIESVNITHIGIVDQRILPQYYNQAKIFILASRQEGLALVQMQALSCGLPIVCSEHTGGIDIANLTGHHEWIMEMQEYNLNSLKFEIIKALEFQKSADYGKLNLKELSWSSYGERYNEFLKNLK